jgi:hypothetical protein
VWLRILEGFQVSRRKKLIGVILTLLAIAILAAWPFWKWLSVKPVSAGLYERTKTLVEQNPRLQPAWDKAMQDGVLTWPEAQAIWEQAGEKIEPDE